MDQLMEISALIFGLSQNAYPIERLQCLYERDTTDQA